MDPILLINEYPKVVSVLLVVSLVCTLVALAVPQGGKADELAQKVPVLREAIAVARELGMNVWGAIQALRSKAK